VVYLPLGALADTRRRRSCFTTLCTCCSYTSERGRKVGVWVDVFVCCK
jgi:hypothetical protein